MASLYQDICDNEIDYKRIYHTNVYTSVTDNYYFKFHL